ncbi:MAG: efflux RND transporter permease subunit [Candidatus Limnocylindrales bacterium]
MIRLTQLAVAKRSVTLLVAAGLFLAGIFAWGQLDQELLPNIALPYVVVVTPVPGASAQDVATQVTEPIERAIGSVPRLEHINSSSVNSISIVVAEFSFGTDVKATTDTVNQAVAALQLPSASTPQIQSLDINALPPVTLSIQAAGTTTQAQLNALAAGTIVPSLQGIDGVSKVDLSGAVEQRVLISLDPARLAATKISLSQIQGVLQANNLVLPAGSLPVGSVSIPVSAQHQFDSVDEIRSLLVGVSTPAAGTGAGSGAGTGTVTGAGQSAGPPTPVTLGDLGTVQLVDVQPTGDAELSGKPALVLTISKTSDANTVNVVTAVQDRLAQLQRQSGSAFQVVTVQDLSSYITESRNSLVREGGLGALFAIVTIFFFLLSLRSTLVAAMSIPLSIMTALALMLVTGISINIMTLGGLAVAVGRVVDDAIVVLENIYRHRSRGDPMRDAVISGTREVASAITSSTLTTVAVFLPLGFVGGLVSQFFLPFALTVTFALLSSLVCALTVVPVLASLFLDRIKLHPEAGPAHHDTLVQRLYTPLLKAALRSRSTCWGVIGIAAVLVAATGLLIPHIPTQFLNAGSEKYLQITVAPPPGTSSADVLTRAQAVESRLLQNSEVTLTEATVPGEGDTGLSTLTAAFTGQAANSATVVAQLDPSVDLDTEQVKLTGQLKGLQEPGWQLQVAQQSMTGGSSISVVVSGADPQAVAAGTSQVLAALRTMPDLINLKSDLASDTAEVQVTVDPNKALLAGTSTAQVQAEIQDALAGEALSTVSLPTGAAQVYLQVQATGLNSVSALARMPVGQTGVPLGSIATVAQVQTQARITRVDQAPAATISADSTNQDTGGVSSEIQTKIDALASAGKLEGVSVTLSGVTEQMNTAFSGLFASMAIAILLVYIVMVLVFDSLIDPFVILFSLPLATVGAFPALFLTGRALGVSALIGFLMLIGIVVTNAIVLLDLVEQHRRRGLPTYEALIEGGRTRVRPILMTAIATILALIPLGLGLSEGEIIASQLATVVIGGLFSSTFLTLIVVPVVYALVEGGKDRVGRRLAPSHGEAIERA